MIGARRASAGQRCKGGRPAWTTWVAVFVVALLAAACGDDGGGGGDGGEAGKTTQTTEAAAKPGGRLVIAVDNEPSGYDPTSDALTTSSMTVAQAIFDTLTVPTAEGGFEPYLAESLEPNDDFTVWTAKLRSGVLFHDGTPLTAEAVKANIDRQIASPLAGPALTPVESVEAVDELTVRWTMRPWASFPAFLSGQLGMIAAPSMFEDPEGSRNPVGTGPFVLEEWIPGRRVLVNKNVDYWRADEGLPYLDTVEFRPILDAQSAVNALLTGDVDVLQTIDAASIATLRGESKIDLHEAGDYPSAEFLLIPNTAIAPFDNLNARKAISHATDRARLIDVIYRGIVDPATGPWAGEEAYGEPKRFPEYDPEAAKKAIEAYKEETGTSSLSVEFTAQPGQLPEAQLLQDMWSAVGIDVQIKQVEQGQLIIKMLLGDFQVALTTLPAAPDPDQQFMFWDADAAADIGQFTPNFGRYANQEMQSLLLEARAEPDEDVRVELYSEVAQIITDDLPFIYLTRQPVAIAANSNVGGLGTFGSYPLPGGGTARQPLAGAIGPIALYRTGE